MKKMNPILKRDVLFSWSRKESTSTIGLGGSSYLGSDISSVGQKSGGNPNEGLPYTGFRICRTIKSDQ